MKLVLVSFLMFGFTSCKNSTSIDKNKYASSNKNSLSYRCRPNASMTLTSTIAGFQPNCVSLAADALKGSPSFMLIAFDKATMSSDKPHSFTLTTLNEYPVPGIYKIGTNFIMDEKKIDNSGEFDSIKNFQISFGMGELLCMNYGGSSVSQSMTITGTLELTKVSPGRGGRLAGNFDLTCQNKRIAGSFDASDYLIDVLK